MKQQLRFKLVSGLFIAVFFAACSGFFDLGEEEIIENQSKDQSLLSTYITIDNTKNRFPVGIYYAPDRISRVAYVHGYQSSGLIPQTPTVTNPRPFYITYNVPILADVLIPFIPAGADGVVSYHINKNETTSISIRSLEAIIGTETVLFNNTAWLAIKNSSNSACSLSYGTSIKTPENNEGRVDFNPGFTALYQLDSVTAISLLKIGNSSFPEEITGFEKGYLYELDFSGTIITLRGSKLLTLNNL